jgi:hypothetical protein
MRWKILTVLFALLVGASLGAWYLRTDSFQERVRSTLVSRIGKATGMNCRIDRVTLNLFRGRFEIRGLELTPRTPGPGSTILRVDEIRAALSVSSFWHFRVRLDDLSILRPRLELVSGGRRSTWNPQQVLKR